MCAQTNTNNTHKYKHAHIYKQREYCLGQLQNLPDGNYGKILICFILFCVDDNRLRSKPISWIIQTIILSMLIYTDFNWEEIVLRCVYTMFLETGLQVFSLETGLQIFSLETDRQIFILTSKQFIINWFNCAYLQSNLSVCMLPKVHKN